MVAGTAAAFGVVVLKQSPPRVAGTAAVVVVLKLPRQWQQELLVLC
jgi:hypothetical protein